MRALRRVVDISRRHRDAQRQGDSTEGHNWPLLVDTFGKPLTKLSIVAFYRGLTEAVGGRAEHVSGHSARQEVCTYEGVGVIPGSGSMACSGISACLRRHRGLGWIAIGRLPRHCWRPALSRAS